MDLDFCELFSPLDFFGQGGTLGRASAERPSAANSPVRDSPVPDSAVGFTGPGFSSFRDSPVRFTGLIHQCAQRAGLETDPRVGTSESGAQPPAGRTKIFSEGPKWTWTFANFFLHWTFRPGCPPLASENTTLKHACFDVVSGVTSEETRLANFYFRTFFRDLATDTRPTTLGTGNKSPASTPSGIHRPQSLFPHSCLKSAKAKKQNPDPTPLPAKATPTLTARAPAASQLANGRRPTGQPGSTHTHTHTHRPWTPLIHSSAPPLYPPPTSQPTNTPYNTIYYIISFDMK
jgi:hypothetical protein